MPKLGLIGAGTMGRGIAQVAATAGWEVVVFDRHEDGLQKASQHLIKTIDRQVEKGKLSQQTADEILGRIGFASEYAHFEDADLLIEAIVEDLAIKKEVFSEVERCVRADTLIASNTSSLSLTSIGAALVDASRFVGIHFFNPAPLMQLVEVIPALQTKEESLQKARNWIDGWGKTTVLAKDTPGFIVNRVARPFYGESLRMLEEGVADIATIDWAMKTYGGFRMGPFELMDFIGNDVNFAVTETVFKSFYYDPRYRPAFTQKRMMEAGFLGRKTNKGYYNYAPDAPQPAPLEDKELGITIFERVLVMLINEAADALYLHIASKEDIDMAMTKGVNYPKGLLRWADEKGIGWCVNQLDDLYDFYREDRYRCSPLLRKLSAENRQFYP